jgi:hypothetical protein
VILVAVVALLSVAGALAVNGRLRRFAQVRIRLAWGLGLAVGAALLSAVPALHGAGTVVTLAAALVVVVANRTLPGMPLLGTGLLLNSAAILANGVSMPVDIDAAVRAGVNPPSQVADPFHTLADAHTRLRLLCDIIPVPWPWRGEVVSVGDVLVAAGVGLFLVSVMLGVLPRRP